VVATRSYVLWITRINDTSRILRGIYPHLLVKQKQARLALQLIETRERWTEAGVSRIKRLIEQDKRREMLA
jgi:hypothetical protein